MRKSPTDLTEKSKAIWKAVDKQYELTDAQYPVLTACLYQYDRMLTSRKAIAESCLYQKSKSTGQLKVNPAVRIERDAYNSFLAGWKALKLDVELIDTAGRPVGGLRKRTGPAPKGTAIDTDGFDEFLDN